MTGHRRGFASLFALALAHLALSRTAHAQGTKLTSAAPKAGQAAPEYLELGPTLTLEQALGKPDATRVMGPNCQITTVGELKKAAALHRKLLVQATTGGSGKTVHPGAANRVRELSQLASSISAEAQASRPGPAALTARVAVASQPGIDAVNRKSTGFQVTPGANLTILGAAFGDAMGQANLIGNFPGGAVPLRVIDWKNNAVFALLPTGLRGVPDQPVTVQIVTAAGRTFRRDGGTFIAAREDVTLTTNVLRVLQFRSSPAWDWSMTSDGSVYRSTQGPSIDCSAVGTDTLTVVDPGKGFVVTGLNANWTGRTDSGDGSEEGEPGSRTYSPGYGFGEWNGNAVAVRWGVFRSHRSANLAIGPMDHCTSSYQIAVTVTGPAGVSPF